MRRTLIVATTFAGLLIAPTLAPAQETVTGAAGGAIAGAVVGGPVGAVIGGVIGGSIGAGAETQRRDAQGRVVDAQGRVIVEQHAPPPMPGAVHERTCVDDGVNKTCTDVRR